MRILKQIVCFIFGHDWLKVGEHYTGLEYGNFYHGSYECFRCGKFHNWQYQG